MKETYLSIPLCYNECVKMEDIKMSKKPVKIVTIGGSSYTQS